MKLSTMKDSHEIGFAARSNFQWFVVSQFGQDFFFDKNSSVSFWRSCFTRDV